MTMTSGNDNKLAVVVNSKQGQIPRPYSFNRYLVLFENTRVHWIPFATTSVRAKGRTSGYKNRFFRTKSHRKQCEKKSVTPESHLQ